MLRIGDNIGPYTLTGKIGRGTFGVVWLAERRTAITTTKVALKLPLDDDLDLESIKQEADLWVQASGHPNILPIIEANIYDDIAIIASEYAPEGALDTWLKQYTNTRPPIETVFSIIDGILAGLEHLHGRRIIHRDLKPANILLQGQNPRLADFGISRVLKTTSQSSNVAGTPAYMAPEAFDGKRNEQTDMWAAAVIFYQLLTGRLPFPQRDAMSLMNAILSRQAEPLTLPFPDSLQLFFDIALHKEPTQRFRSVIYMRQALREMLREIQKHKESEAIPVFGQNIKDDESTIINPRIGKDTGAQENVGTQNDALPVLPYQYKPIKTSTPHPPMKPEHLNRQEPIITKPGNIKGTLDIQASSYVNSQVKWIVSGVFLIFFIAVGIAGYLLVKEKNKSADIVSHSDNANEKKVVTIGNENIATNSTKPAKAKEPTPAINANRTQEKEALPITTGQAGLPPPPPPIEPNSKPNSVPPVPTIIRKSGAVLAGSAIRRVEPVYPPLAKVARVSGTVVVEVTVDEAGNVISARGLAGHPLLKDSAVVAARGWKFTPTQLAGVRVKVVGTITFNYNL